MLAELESPFPHTTWLVCRSEPARRVPIAWKDSTQLQMQHGLVAANPQWAAFQSGAVRLSNQDQDMLHHLSKP